MLSTFMSAILLLIVTLSIFIIGSTSEYWGVIYRYWAMSCAGLMLLTFLITNWFLGKQFQKRYLQIALLAWGLCLIPLALFNATSLCVGQDNGDGNNSMLMCGIYSIIWWIYQSILVVPIILVLDFLTRKVVNKRV